MIPPNFRLEPWQERHGEYWIYEKDVRIYTAVESCDPDLGTLNDLATATARNREFIAA